MTKKSILHSYLHFKKRLIIEENQIVTQNISCEYLSKIIGIYFTFNQYTKLFLEDVIKPKTVFISGGKYLDCRLLKGIIAFFPPKKQFMY